MRVLVPFMRAFLHISLFSLGVFCANRGMQEIVPERLKIEWYETIQDEVDVIFLGSSHVFRQFDPAIFDAQRQNEGDAYRSVNLAALGMGFMEQAYILERILEQDAEPLQWVVLEALPFELGMQNENDFGLRRIGWHDTPTTWFLVREIWKSELPDAEKQSLVRRHIEHWWRKSLFLARGKDAVATWGLKPLENFEDQSALGVERNGYVPLEVSTADAQSRGMRKKFRSAPQKLTNAARSLPNAGDGGQPGGGQLKMVRKMEALAAKHNVTLIWWIHPNLKRYRGWRQMKEAGDIQHLIAYDDPETHPELYRPQAHFDLDHLNKQASERMTMTFAFDFVNLVQAENN